MNLDEYLRSFVTEGVSDIHFKVGRPPLSRIHGSLSETQSALLRPADTEALAKAILGEDAWKRFCEMHEYDSSYSIAGFSRFRVSVFRQRGSISIALRIIPFDVPTLDDLGLPQVTHDIARIERGLVLVTGATGSGKSSTIAGIINDINENRRCHIVTIEDPIEFLHRDKLSAVNQREIGVDTQSFSNAFRASLRQDPNVIFVGELRDALTMGIALRAAETGHLVLSTLHTTDAKETVSRLIDSFPPYQQKQIRIQIANTLKAVVCQRLLERGDRPGRVVAAEIMIVNAAIREYILAPYGSDRIHEHIAKGKDQYGMQTFDQALIDLVRESKITVDEALRYATSPNDLRLKLSLD